MKLAERLYAHVVELRNEVDLLGDQLVLLGWEDTRPRYRQQKTVYASGVTDCARQIALSVIGLKKEPTGEDYPQWSVVAEFGTAIHELVERWLREIGVLVRAEFRVTDPNNVLSGRVDALIRAAGLEPDPIDEETPDIEALVDVAGEEYILDVKTVGDKDFKEGAWGRKFKKYVAQISVYGKILGVKKGLVLLVNRGTGELQDIEFDIDFDYADQLLARVPPSWDGRAPGSTGSGGLGRGRRWICLCNVLPFLRALQEGTPERVHLNAACCWTRFARFVDHH